jgi:curved DNA-binding protein CbpA
MFKDYYFILEVNVNSTQEEIKAAFKRQALKWHPDHNLGMDTTNKMQDINEAKLILLDCEARERYNREYFRFKEFQKRKEQSQKIDEERQKKYQQKRQSQREKQEKQNIYDYSEYSVEDDILNKWMNNARKQAVDMAKQTIEDFKNMTKEGINAASEKIGNLLPSLLIMAGVFLLIAILIKSCNN